MTILSHKKKFDGTANIIGEARAGDSTGIVTIIFRNGKSSIKELIK